MFYNEIWCLLHEFCWRSSADRLCYPARLL